MSLRNKLNRLKPHISGGSQPTANPPSGTGSTTIEVPFKEKWEQEDVYPYFLDEDYCLIREVKFPLSHQHGHYRFGEFLEAVKIWNDKGFGHPLSAKGFAADELFFFDTETTGLGSGVGNTIFLLGYASVKEDQVILRQHLLPHPGAEVALYQSFLEKINYKTLVTYNGKAFDWPQVKTRHTLVRDHVPKLPAFGHFDLFHAARRLWKHKLERLKLAIVEKEVLGVERVNDIPGFLAPMIYFDFIERKEPDGILGILKHNELDILSLITLYTHLTFQLCGIDSKQSRMETFEVGRWYAAIGENKQAEKVLGKLTTGTDTASCLAKLTLAYQHKKNRDWEQARILFMEAADIEDEQIALEVCLELAKIHEHRLKDYKLAMDFCRRALEIMEGSEKISPDDPAVEQFQLRLARLERKKSRI
ncbi:ribonuclease H-like domain-containing protein [Bacillus sp. FJAT-29814]|uniref:ribonuclease H-like domain-containing protein n=1 Tax=Bacillus sp. FJAT-29814 TaxID=1729688 RepID=UPI0008305D05|nr:ribonuclease H-like domain-containing protein [Bacillus sp. FJAT-29814]